MIIGGTAAVQHLVVHAAGAVDEHNPGDGVVWRIRGRLRHSSFLIDSADVSCLTSDC